MLNTRRKKEVRKINIIQKGKQVYYSSTPLPKYLAVTVFYPTAKLCCSACLIGPRKAGKCSWTTKIWNLVVIYNS